MQDNNNSDTNFLPVGIRLRGQVLIVGGGRVASHKATILSRFTHDFCVIAPSVTPELKALAAQTYERKVTDDDLRVARLIYICTDDHDLNARLKRRAEELGVLASVCDAPDLCDFISPAIYKVGNMTIAVGSDGRDVRRSIRIRDRIKQLIDDGLLQVD